MIPLRAGSIRLPPEIAKYQYIDKSDPDWKLNLAKSITSRASQLNEETPTSVVDFISRHDLIGPRLLRNEHFENKNIRLSAEYFTYTQDESYWLYVTSKIGALVYDNYYDRMFPEDMDLTDVDTMKSWWAVRVEEFFRVDELISLRFFTDWYGAGAAHPNRETFTLNFCGAQFGELTLRILLSGDAENLNYLREYCEVDLRRQFLHLGTEHWSLPAEQKDLWEKLSQFNFDAEGLIINFSPYAVTAYAGGQWEVKIPWHALADQLAPHVAKGPLGALIEARPRPIPASY